MPRIKAGVLAFHMHRMAQGRIPQVQIRIVLTLATVISAVCVPAPASEADALAISANIRAQHMPFGTILDPIYASATGNQIVGYTRCGDSALWTGAYLAAEAFRYKVTQSADAFNNLKSALA